MFQDRRRTLKALAAPLLLAGLGNGEYIPAIAATVEKSRKTRVSIQGNAFFINGRPTYPGRTYNGKKIEGLLFTSRMANAIFDDHNPETREVWPMPMAPGTQNVIPTNSLPIFRAISPVV